jgi:toxin HigB-1
VIASFADKVSQDLYNGANTKEAQTIPKALWPTVTRKLDMVNAAHALFDLSSPPGNRLEALKGNRKGLHSIRVNDQYRIVFRWAEGNAYDVHVTDYH